MSYMQHADDDNADRIAALEAEVERLRGREAHFAKVLGVTDGGEYRNDWDAKLTRLLAIERAAREALRSHVYTFPVPDDDGNVARAEKVERILREALDA